MVMSRQCSKSYMGSIRSSCIEERRGLKCSVVVCNMGSFRSGLVNELESDVLKHALISERR